MSISTADIVRPRIPARILFPAGVGLGIYGLLMPAGARLLNDPDTYWQVRIGQSIIETGALPHADGFSFTMTGQPWISTQWLAQAIYAIVYGAFGWAGLVVLTSASIALTFVLLARFLERRLPVAPALMLLLCGFAIGAPHFLARPHTLAMPVMVAWVAGLVAAAERRAAPSPWLLPLMALWTNLHGSFVLGLALVAPVAFDALWNAQAEKRPRLALLWFGFLLAAVAASCLTPYGWESLLAAKKILSLGQALSLIGEWRPVDLSKWEGVSLFLFAGLGGVLLTGFTLTLPRVLLFVGLLYMALSHSRNVDVFALLSPIVLAAPLAMRLGVRTGVMSTTDENPQASLRWSAAAILLACVLTFTIVPMRRYSPPAATSPSAAIAALKERKVSRVFNDYDYGGYLIWSGLPTFIDGRTELFGEDFMVRYDDAASLKNPQALFDLLKAYNIEATLLHRTTPAARLLDRTDGWTRIYADDSVVVHMRTDASANTTLQ
ncbi:MAG: hypothetical protein EKK40_01425 [Bradyrhizobiaceae bacterium]|nr:MAG: hypothetical protein EKK40_01425 [Bradyrhizobiaceae bacterium]